MASQPFGKRIRELRTKRKLTQQELATQSSIDIGYVSKIEADKVPPPSEKVISRLAAVLKADKDELMMLGGRAPKDIEPIITNNPRVPAILRRAKNLSSQDWEKVERYIQELKTSKREG